MVTDASTCGSGSGPLITREAIYCQSRYCRALLGTTGHWRSVAAQPQQLHTEPSQALPLCLHAAAPSPAPAGASTPRPPQCLFPSPSPPTLAPNPPSPAHLGQVSRVGPALHPPPFLPVPSLVTLSAPRPARRGRGLVSTHPPIPSRLPLSLSAHLGQRVARGLHKRGVEGAAHGHRHRLERALGGGQALRLLQRVLVAWAVARRGRGDSSSLWEKALQHWPAIAGYRRLCTLTLRWTTCLEPQRHWLRPAAGCTQRPPSQPAQGAEIRAQYPCRT